jgi:hypothetical protein
MFAAVGGIADQRSAAEVDYEIQVFQRQLTDQDGHISRRFSILASVRTRPTGSGSMILSSPSCLATFTTRG